MLPSDQTKIEFGIMTTNIFFVRIETTCAKIKALADINYSLRPKLYVTLRRNNCLRLYVALQYQ